MQKQTDKVFGKSALEHTRLTTHVVEGTMHTERVKVEVVSLSDIVEVEKSEGFVRFAHGGYKDIHELVARRKAEGRSDWYA
jgi:hypothetical protein